MTISSINVARGFADFAQVVNVLRRSVHRVTVADALSGDRTGWVDVAVWIGSSWGLATYRKSVYETRIMQSECATTHDQNGEKQ
ncbi:hypothetical protein N7534_003550 [Penicillium rubens]|nr:hypothetical protein N7534_003550 [Penicillium rubens]